MEKEKDAPNEMDVKKRILDFLLVMDCTTEERNGIIYVTTPTGRVWDFTVPLRRVKENA